MTRLTGLLGELLLDTRNQRGEVGGRGWDAMNRAYASSGQKKLGSSDTSTDFGSN